MTNRLDIFLILGQVQKSGIVDSVLNWAKFKADQQIKKTDGTKRSRWVCLQVESTRCLISFLKAARNSEAFRC